MKKHTSFYRDEEDILRRAKLLLGNAEHADHPLCGVLRELPESYERLSRQTDKIVKISDRQEKKLNEINDHLRKLSDELQVEKERSERLLLNVLPHKVVADLKNSGRTEAETFENVTVLFADFCDFTRTAAHLEPRVLIAELNDMYTRFDEIIEEELCERIKTVGDAYLAVSGMPAADPGHARNILRAAVRMRAYLVERNGQAPISWRIRMGINSGKLVGGVVGIRKYIYDVFGETINTAARRQAHCEPMQIFVTEATHALVRDEHSFTMRKDVDVKGKGVLQIYCL